LPKPGFAIVILIGAKELGINLRVDTGMLRFAQHDNFDVFTSLQKGRESPSDKISGP
jgi:hypothetical protein